MKTRNAIRTGQDRATGTDALSCLRERLLAAVDHNATKPVHPHDQRNNTRRRRELFGEHAIKHTIAPEVRQKGLDTIAQAKRCTATLANGLPCRQFAAYGTELCRNHLPHNRRAALRAAQYREPEDALRRKAVVKACARGQIPFQAEDWRDPLLQSANEVLGLFPRNHYPTSALPAIVQAQLGIRLSAVRRAMIEKYGDDRGSRQFRRRRDWFRDHAEEIVQCWFARKNGDVSAWLVILARADDFGYDEPVLPVNWDFQGVL